MPRSAPLGEVELAVLHAIHEKGHDPSASMYYFIGMLGSQYSAASIKRAFKELLRRRYIHKDIHYYVDERAYKEKLVRSSDPRRE